MTLPPAAPLGLSPEDQQTWTCHMQLARQAQTPWLFAVLLLALILLAVCVLAVGRLRQAPVASEAVVPLDPATLDSNNAFAHVPPMR
ncbi:MAG: hypothetical protein HY902_19500 [Deltaproteobacteria bacterium]|nr:hypothetical protein [Deltaproteobacteria bacterium]